MRAERSRWRLARPVVRVAWLTVLAVACRGGEGVSLDMLEREIAASYELEQVAPDTLAERLANAPERVLLLDARSPEEYAVGHIAGAIRVDSTLRPRAFAKRFGGDLRGREVVLYCSVGVRSSRLGERVAEVAAEAGATGVANLGGGIFRWRNEGREVVDALGPTPYVHPYSARWGRLLDDPGWAQEEPRGGAGRAPR